MPSKVLETIFNSAPLGLYVVQEGLLVLANPKMSEITGYPPEDLLRVPFSSLIHPEDRDLVPLMPGQAGEKDSRSYYFRIISFRKEIIYVHSYHSGIKYSGRAAVLGQMIHMEEALRESDERYRELFENANDIIYTHDLEGNFLSANTAAIKTFGFTPEELLRSNINRVLDPDYLPLAVENMRLKIEKNLDRTGPYELLTYTREGTPVWVEVKSRLIKHMGRPVAVQGIARDITERKQFEIKLLESERKLKNKVDYLNTLIENINDIFMTYDTNAKITFIAKRCQEKLGFSPEELIGKNVLEIVHPDYREKVLQGIRHRLKKGKPGSYEILGLHKDGRGISVKLNVSPIFEDGKITGAMAVAEDITERKNSELALVKSEARNRALLNAIPDFMFVINREGYFIDYKTARGDVFLAPSGEIMLSGKLVGRNLFDICPRELANQTMLYIDRTISTGETQVFEYEIILNKRSLFQEARIIISGESDVLVIVRDITERKKMERQLSFLSLHDPLTGLYNRAYFEQELRRLEDGRHTSAGIILCDVDGLKIVNDSLGHDAGDTLLAVTAGVIRTSFRGSDMVARIGGDEFAVLLSNCS
ncbi:MAG: PAS domain S-box protein, partial [Desulfocucumaceae bacterium]